MRFGKTAWICLLAMMLVIPITVKAQTPTQTPAQAQVPVAEVIPEAEIRQAIDQYIDRFKAMDLDLFMTVFSKQAVENRMFPYADMREAYGRTFKNSNQILYFLNILGIQSYTNSAFVNGYYEIIQTTKPDNEFKIYKGNIQWELVREEGGLKILRLNHGTVM
jgi:hypothetical protein